MAIIFYSFGIATIGLILLILMAISFLLVVLLFFQRKKRKNLKKLKKAILISLAMLAINLIFFTMTSASTYIKFYFFPPCDKRYTEVVKVIDIPETIGFNFDPPQNCGYHCVDILVNTDIKRVIVPNNISYYLANKGKKGCLKKREFYPKIGGQTIKENKLKITINEKQCLYKERTEERSEVQFYGFGFHTAFRYGDEECYEIKDQNEWTLSRYCITNNTRTASCYNLEEQVALRRRLYLDLFK